VEMSTRRSAGLARASEDTRAAGTSRVRMLTAALGLGGLTGTAAIAWGVAPHASAAPTYEEIEVEVIETVSPTPSPDPVPTTLRTPTPGKPVVRPPVQTPAPVVTRKVVKKKVVKKVRRQPSPAPVATSGGS
jgi:hypothetical protein